MPQIACNGLAYETTARSQFRHGHSYEFAQSDGTTIRAYTYDSCITTGDLFLYR